VNAISRYPIPELSELPDDIREMIETVQERSGFVPNIFLGLAYRPDEFRSFFAYHDAILERKGNLTKAEKELVVVATSAANNCSYCVVAHGAILRIRAKDPLIADKVAVNYRSADLEPRQRAILDFALKVAKQADELTEDDYSALETHGLDRDDIWDIGAIAAFFALSNRMAHLMDLKPNSEFYTLGRDS
jgi:uncharacterized peroxidase-related enzyme